MLNVENFAGVAYRIVALIAFLCRLASLATPLGWGARQGQGRRHEVLMGGGDGFTGTQSHLPPQFRFSLDFDHFILKMLVNTQKLKVLRKKFLKHPNLWWVDPRGFQKCGGRDPRPPPSATPLEKDLICPPRPQKRTVG